MLKAGGAVCGINETSPAAVMTKIFKWHQANINKKQFSKPN